MTDREFKKLTVETLARVCLEQKPTDEECQAVEEYERQATPEEFQRVVKELTDDLLLMAKQYDFPHTTETIKRAVQDQLQVVHTPEEELQLHEACLALGLPGLENSRIERLQQIIRDQSQS